METYSYPEKKDMRNEEELPIKENDHAVDALRYPLMMIESGFRQKAHTTLPQHHVYTETNRPQMSGMEPHSRPKPATTFYPKR